MFNREPAFQHDAFQAKIGVLLINLGTPAAPTTAAVKPYLQQFLSDQRVVELPRLLWQVILRGIILPTRSPKSAEKYASIWLAEGSPLAVYTQRQTEKVVQQLAVSDSHIQVDYAMRYGQPSIEQAISRFKAQGVTHLFALPLYPQYAGSSSGTAMDEVYRTLLKQRNMMNLRTLTRFHDHPFYIHALADSVKRHWQMQGQQDLLLMSFHGVPQATLTQGDPYFCECHKTARLLAEALGLSDQRYRVGFQSRFGKAKWVGPSTQQLFEQLPHQGVKTLDVICPGFVSDCIETLEEIAIDGHKSFLAHGGEHFSYIPCLNDDPIWIDALVGMITEQLLGWQLATVNQAQQQQRQQRQMAIERLNSES